MKFTGTYQPGKKVCLQEGEELLEKDRVSSFKSGRIRVNCWAAIAYGSRTPLVRVRKRKQSERTTARDCLGLNSAQYATEIYDPHLIPFLFALDKPISKLEVIEDNAKYHLAGLNREISSAFGVQKLPLPANSPDLNLIENVWYIFKQQLLRRFSKGERPHCEGQLWGIMEKEWDALNQGVINRLIDSMPSRILAIVNAGGSHIKW